VKHLWKASVWLSVGASTVVVALAACSSTSPTPKASGVTPRSTTSATQSYRRDDGTKLTGVITRLFGIASPSTSGRVVSGAPCDHPSVLPFCPFVWRATADGRKMAVSGGPGQIAVIDIPSGKVLFQKHLTVAPAPQIFDQVKVWISPDGRFVSTDVTAGGATLNFGIWRVRDGQSLLTAVPTVHAPWAPVESVAFSPDGGIMLIQSAGTGGADWLAAKLVDGQLEDQGSYHNATDESDVIYSAAQQAWIVTRRDGYSIWKPPGQPRAVHFPACEGAASAAVDSEGRSFACDTGGSPVNGASYVSEWDIGTARLKRKFTIAPHGVVGVGGIVLREGGSQAIVLAGTDTSISTSKSLLVYALRSSPVLQSATKLPGVSGGWYIDAVGKFILATGYSTKGGNCCFTVVSTEPD
jgi:hypothetical protein